MAVAADNEKNHCIEIKVSEDRLKAWGRLRGTSSASFTLPTAPDVIQALEAAKVQITDAVRARAEEAVVSWTNMHAGAAPGEAVYPDMLLAECPPPKDAEDGRFECAPELHGHRPAPDENAQIDYFAVNAIVTVAAGTVVGKLYPPKNGQPTTDVFGMPIPPRVATGMQVRLGSGLALVDGGDGDVVAATAGRVVEEEGSVRLNEVLEIPGDVDFSSGSLDAVVDVTVQGTIRANFHVRTKKSLTVGRLIEAADVEVGGDVAVRGGVFGHEDAGSLRAGGNVSASFFNETRVEVDGDVTFDKEILNSRVRVKGRIIGERGTVIGGDIYAREGITVRVLGSDACVATSVTVGTDLRKLRRAKRLEKEVREFQKSAEQVRQTIQPLMANVKRLLPEQRERVTELMCKADEVDMRAADAETERSKLLMEAAAHNGASLYVSEALHPGVHVVIDAREFHVSKLMHGPIRIELRKINNITQVAAVNQRTGSVTVIPATDVDLVSCGSDDDEDEEVKGVEKHGADEPTTDSQRA